ncbi:SWEET sugar transporter [Dillenia turbinata]|uniref:Bidirectional sugar transporter SWEET n=1 Tax=Dillenia turbinata TaxID=194707 RepID=A0AAN8YUN2_9MAGN
MASLSFYVGVIGNIISVLVFLSPVGTFLRIIKHRSTEEFESIPYVCTLLSSSLWTYYGLNKSGEILVSTVNGFGILVEATYVILFLIFAPPSMRAKTATLVATLDIGFLAAAILVSRLALTGDACMNAMGYICAGLNIVMYGSPLAAMKTVVTTKSVEYMPFSLSFFLFLNGGIWTLYAVLVDDFFLGVANGVGFLLGTAQLVLYGMYRNAKPSRNNTSDVLEEGWQHERLVEPSSDFHDKNEV